VIAGEIGSRPFGYTTVGKQVDGPADEIGCPARWGDAQRVDRTAVEAAAVLGELQMVHIKGSDEPVAAGSDPMTLPVISCSRIIASFVV
jgi:adenylate cyclase